MTELGEVVEFFACPLCGLPRNHRRQASNELVGGVSSLLRMYMGGDTPSNQPSIKSTVLEAKYTSMAMQRQKKKHSSQTHRVHTA